MQLKAVLKLDLHGDKDKKKALKVVSDFTGIDSIDMNMKDRKLMVMGDFDLIHIVGKLRKLFPTQIESVGPAKEEKKGNDQGTANDGNKNGGGGGGGGGVVPYPFPIPHQYPPCIYQNYLPRPAPPMFYYDRPHSVEEDPNGCVIC